MCSRYRRSRYAGWPPRLLHWRSASTNVMVLVCSVNVGGGVGVDGSSCCTLAALMPTTAGWMSSGSEVPCTYVKLISAAWGNQAEHRGAMLASVT